MEKFAVIDTETNWNDEVMSIGVVIAEAETFKVCELKYYILNPEYLVGGMYSHTLKMNWNLKCNPLECSRKQAIQDLLLCLHNNKIKRIFAYNASFDYRHLPELNTFIWYVIMRLAAYRQFNNKIKEEDCCSTGRLKRNFGVESIKKLLTGLIGEHHNALCDALDELIYIMKPLGHKIDEYMPYNTPLGTIIELNKQNEIIEQPNLEQEADAELERSFNNIVETVRDEKDCLIWQTKKAISQEMMYAICRKFLQLNKQHMNNKTLFLEYSVYNSKFFEYVSVECSCINDILEIYKNLLRQKKVFMAPTFYHLEIGKNRVEIIIDFKTKTDLLLYKENFKYANKQLIKVQ